MKTHIRQCYKFGFHCQMLKMSFSRKGKESLIYLPVFLFCLFFLYLRFSLVTISFLWRTSFRSNGRAVCWAQILSFPSSDNVLISPSFLKDIFTGTELWGDSSFCTLASVFLPRNPPHLNRPSPGRTASFLWCGSEESGLQKPDDQVSWCGFLWVYPVRVSFTLESVGLVLSPDLGNYQSLFLWIHFQPPGTRMLN